MCSNIVEAIQLSCMMELKSVKISCASAGEKTYFALRNCIVRFQIGDVTVVSESKSTCHDRCGGGFGEMGDPLLLLVPVR